MVKKLKDSGQEDHTKRTRIFFLVVIILYTFFLYGNTVKNMYSLDDYIIFGQDEQLVKEGIRAIGDIFTSPYTRTSTLDGEEISFGYHPIGRLAYALEYSLVDNSNNKRPGISHLINILFFLVVVLVLYRILQRIFRDYSIWFPFVIILLFIAHPVHTEVVASLKNRDELLSMLFSLLTLQMLLKYHDKSKLIYLVLGLFLYILAFLSKSTALAFWLVFPLTLYFFTNMNWKKIGMISGLITLMIVLGWLVPFWFLDGGRDVSMVENPLYFEDNIWYIFGTGFYSLGYYFRLLLIPYPLLYYYGYDMIPVVNLGNLWVLLTILFYAGILGIAIWKAREKHVVSYAIFFYLFTIAMFSNIGQAVPGIIGERFLLIPSIGFVIVLAWLVFKLFKAVPESVSNNGIKVFFVLVFTALILVPYSVLTVNRNKDWYSESSLLLGDMEFLDKSVMAHGLMGNAIKRSVEYELSKKVNVAKFIMPNVNRALNHFQQAVEIWPGHTSSWKNMGMIYNNPRIAEHLIANGDTAKFLELKTNAISSFSRALELEPGDGDALFNLGLTYEYMGETDSAIYYYEKCIQNNPQVINPRSRLADLKFIQGFMQEAIDLNKEITRIDPMDALPYISFGNYYMMMGDTLKAVESYEEAAKRNTRSEVFAFLSEYFLNRGDMKKAQSYRDKYMEAVKP